MTTREYATYFLVVECRNTYPPPRLRVQCRPILTRTSQAKVLFIQIYSVSTRARLGLAVRRRLQEGLWDAARNSLAPPPQARQKPFFVVFLLGIPQEPPGLCRRPSRARSTN